MVHLLNKLTSLASFIWRLALSLLCEISHLNRSDKQFVNSDTSVPFLNSVFLVKRFLKCRILYGGMVVFLHKYFLLHYECKCIFMYLWHILHFSFFFSLQTALLTSAKRFL